MLAQMEEHAGFCTHRCLDSFVRNGDHVMIVTFELFKNLVQVPGNFEYTLHNCKMGVASMDMCGHRSHYY